MASSDYDSAIQALSSVTRREILDLVRNHELSAGEIAAHFPMSRPAVSHHLRVLRESGLVQDRRDGARRLFRPDRDKIGEVLAELGRIQSD